MNLFRKLVAYLLLILSVLMPAKPDQLILTTNSATPETVIIECENKTGKVLIMTQEFTLEKQSGNNWEEVKFSESFAGFEEMARELLPTQKMQIKIDTLSCFGKELENGTYRVNINAFMNGKGNITASTEFTIAR
ncbi:MAG: hypothetical protein NC122_03120 [Faecalibacterium sp.]|nr:hypothetical protein [Ruminococcus sp.]MCM1392486.1 hypothetical protein [Ruminococcus sp.]MCM1485177.1 hypothetical protein [Faecalibacterium sp.]